MTARARLQSTVVPCPICGRDIAVTIREAGLDGLADVIKPCHCRLGEAGIRALLDGARRRLGLVPGEEATR